MIKPVSRYRFSFHRHALLRHIWFRLFYSNKKDFSKREKNLVRFYYKYKVDIDNPRTFNEYLLWIKHHYRNDEWPTYVDKIKCKEFLASKGFEECLPKTLAIYKSSKEINLDNLPDIFVLKTNHDCGSVFVCKKGKTNFDKVFKKLDDALSQNYSTEHFEWFYDSVEPKIFAEEYLEPAEEKELVDYKFMTFNGEVKFGYVGQNRQTDLRFALFEPGFEYVDCEYAHLKPKKKDIVKKPANYGELEKLAERVGSLFDFVRVDLYNTSDGPKIGELTFIPMSGIGAFSKQEYDFKYGKYFENTIFGKLAKKRN